MRVCSPTSRQCPATSAGPLMPFAGSTGPSPHFSSNPPITVWKLKWGIERFEGVEQFARGRHEIARRVTNFARQPQDIARRSLEFARGSTDFARCDNPSINVDFRQLPKIVIWKIFFNL